MLQKLCTCAFGTAVIHTVLVTACDFQAEDFNESVQVVREWLPQVEAELKFRSLPDNEEAIVQRIEQHDVSSSLLHSVRPTICKY